MKLPYWLKNLPHRARGVRQELHRVAGINVQAELSAVHIDRNGVRTNLGVISRRVVTTVGAAWLATAFTNTVEAEALNFHDCGTGVGSEATGNTALGTAYGGSRATGTQSTPGSTNVYRSVGTISFTSTLAITEHGLFTASTSGTLFDRSVFSAINVVSGDAIQWTWDLTLPAGG